MIDIVRGAAEDATTSVHSYAEIDDSVRNRERATR
jgi:hypothetical protein